MSCTQRLSEELRTRGFRMTPQRQAIMHILKQSEGHLSPAQVYNEAVRSVPGLTEATVYRTLEFLAANDILRPALTSTGHLTYEISTQQHHHLLCRRCGREVQIEYGLIKGLYTSLESETGFRSIDTHITFFGLCPDCQDSPG